MHRSMGKGPLIFVLDKARFPYDLVKATVDRCRSRMRLDMALSQKFDNLLGIVGAEAGGATPEAQLRLNGRFELGIIEVFAVPSRSLARTLAACW